MLVAISAFKDYTIQASDGDVGTVSDFLFEDTTWKIKWLVVDTGGWLTGRKVLVHPSSIGRADHDRQSLPVTLTKLQVERSPEIAKDEPVSGQMEANLYNYYGWDPYWGNSYFGPSALGVPVGGLSLGSPAYFSGSAPNEQFLSEAELKDQDPHLRSFVAVKGYHIHATDGEIGHVENFLIDDASWDVRYLIVDTRNWWPGKHVLLSPYAVHDISWSKHEILLDISREKVKTAPPWDPADIVNRAYETRLHGHYGWGGYGF